MFVAMIEAVKEQCVASLFDAAINAGPEPQSKPVQAPLRLAEFSAAVAPRMVSADS